MPTVKLNNAFVPKSYALDIHIDLSTWSYSAHETIVLEPALDFSPSDTETKDIIRLHAGKKMNLQRVEGATVVKRDKSMQTLHLRLDDALLSKAEPRLVFSFTNEINEAMQGFYRVNLEHKGEKLRMASTHFEPTSARLFFICQDEPARRADFTLTVRLPKEYAEYKVISNGLLRRRVEDAYGDVVHEFDTIPLCPPYLTACVIGPLGAISMKSSLGIPISVYTTPGKEARADFALRTTAAALDLFENFFQCKYPLAKLDVVALPDFPIGGMENWGCITCVESILVDSHVSSVSYLKRASELLCHEVSHNWFGNLVAINWWEGLWLKEGFASWCGHYASNMLHPEWNSLSGAVEMVSAAMNMDMSEYSHPVEVPIGDPAEITEIFDSISYNKGMGLVFMLESFLGGEWGKSVAHYINKYQYKDTKTEQLWDALEEASQMPVKDVMSTFTMQMGHPIVAVSRTADAKGLVLQQEPCKYASSAVRPKTTWCVPVTIQDAYGHKMTIMLRDLEPTKVELPAELQGEDVWLTANSNRCGFFRCCYDDALFQTWLERFNVLKPVDKQALIADTFALLWMGKTTALARISALGKALKDSKEENRYVLQEFVHGLSNIANCFDAKTKRSIIVAQLSFILPMAQSSIKQCPANAEEEMLQSFLVATALTIIMFDASQIGQSPLLENPIVQWCITQAKNFLCNSEYSRAVLGKCLALYMFINDGADSTSKKNDLLFSRLIKEDGNDEISRALIEGLFMSSDTDFVKRMAIRCMHSDGVRSQFGVNVFRAMEANPSFGKGALWEFFKENFAAIDQQWGGGQFQIQIIVNTVAKSLSASEAAAKEFENFFKEHPLPNARLEIGRSAETLRLYSYISQNCAQQSALLYTA